MTDTTANLTGVSGVASQLPACVVQIHGDPLGRRIQLGTSSVAIGRVEGSELLVQESTVSRKHARLFPYSGAWWVEDLGSRNGTHINAVEIDEPTRLASGDLIRVGRAVFKFLESGEVESLFHEAIRHMNLTDGLTGIANRRHLEDFLDRELIRARRCGHPLSVVFLDLDHFKRVNDQFGHLAGDEVLRVVARRLAGMIRGSELIARFGGEEFAIVLPELSQAEAMIACERFRSQIAAEPVRFEKAVIPVTASFGVAAALPQETVQDLLQRSDQFLYAAKNAGRNCVKSGPDGSSP